jgi:hypothetical protein
MIRAMPSQDFGIGTDWQTATVMVGPVASAGQCSVDRPASDARPIGDILRQVLARYQLEPQSPAPPIVLSGVPSDVLSDQASPACQSPSLSLS